MTKPRSRPRADAQAVRVADGYRNLVANLGTERDKFTGGAYQPRVMSDTELLAAYRSSWVARKIVDIIPADATRRWRAWQADKDQITAIEAEEKRLGLKVKVRDAMVAARLWGGAAIYIGTGEANPEEPLDTGRIGKGGLRHINVLVKSRITPGEIETDPQSERYGKPSGYTMATAQGKQIKIHPTRLAVFGGASLPVGADGMTDGWDDSVLQSVMDAVLQSDGAMSAIASLIFEAKVDVIKIPSLMASMSLPGYEQKLIERFTLAARGKGINGTLIMDAEEEYDQKSASFSTLPDLIDRFFQNVSGAADIPATRLLGMTPAGLNATGESDTRNYYDRVQHMQEVEIQPAMTMLDETLIRSALGARPPELHFIWRSLWQTTEKERAEIGKITAETVAALKGTDLFPLETLQAAAANAMIESGALPGLEAAISDFGLELDGAEPADDPAALPPDPADPMEDNP